MSQRIDSKHANRPNQPVANASAPERVHVHQVRHRRTAQCSKQERDAEELKHGWDIGRVAGTVAG